MVNHTQSKIANESLKMSKSLETQIGLENDCNTGEIIDEVSVVDDDDNSDEITRNCIYAVQETFPDLQKSNSNPNEVKNQITVDSVYAGRRNSYDSNISTEVEDNELSSAAENSSTVQAFDGSNRTGNEHQLWVNLSSLGEGNVFAQLPQLFEKMLADQLASDDKDNNFDMTLPSDYEWRTKVYLKMLAHKRMLDSMDCPVPDVVAPVLHYWNIVPKEREKKICSKADIRRIYKTESGYGPGPITWTVKDIAIAGCLLAQPPMCTQFEDEQEMRRVYKLIYDVFRYKSILNRALNDISFFLENPQHHGSQSRIWLLLYDLYYRSFKKRETSVAKQAKMLFANAGLTEIENVLWKNRIKIAAAVSRIRIKHSALRLNDLLPLHLRDEKVTSSEDKTPVSCWANIRKVKTAEEVTSAVVQLLDLNLVTEKDELTPSTFKWDNHCPQFIMFHPSVRTKLAQSQLVKTHQIVVQDRSFCLGPATFGKIVSDLQLTGSVIQSHVNSPRSTAYLATLLSQNLKINKLLAFSAGSRKQEYDRYFHELGMKNILTYSERLIDSPTDASYLEEIVAVFATPPNSYSAVNDPIDLVCSRGGDLSMLEALTEAEETQEGRQRVSDILDEQRKTLRFAMSRPQIQLVLYETHSELDAENNGMVQRALREINKATRHHHASLQGKIKLASTHSETLLPENKEINNNEKISEEEAVNEDNKRNTTSQRRSAASIGSIHSFDDQRYKDVVVPDTDIFDVPNVPDLCPNTEICLNLMKEGCFLALIQRKRVTRLDNKYMIEMAEARGLFGNAASASGRGKGSKTRSKKQEKPPSPVHKKRKSKFLEIERIMAPTVSSAMHSNLSCNFPQCPRCRPLLPKVPQTRRWWTETTRHLTNLRTSLVKQKLLPPAKTSENRPVVKAFVNTLINNTSKIDEILAKTNTHSNIPVYPRLRLSRQQKSEKMPLQLSVTCVQFPLPTMSII